MTDLNTIFQDLYHAQSEMTDWDREFYISLKQQFETKSRLSTAQEYHLERMSKRYDERTLAEGRAFKANYDQAHRQVAVQVARYYDVQHPRYYGNIVDVVLQDPENHVLTLEQWRKMCENKYALKIRAVYEHDDKFGAGDFVQIRANNRVDLANIGPDGRQLPSYKRAKVNGQISNKYAMILKSQAKPVTRAAKGSKIYQILLTDESQTIFAHESDLKKARRTKK